MIASNLVLLVPGANIYHFGVLSSAHAYGLGAAGRRTPEIGYRYSNRIVYNNFPWPIEPTESQVARVELMRKRVLDERVEWGDGRAGFLPAKRKGGQSACLADLYGRDSMPLSLYKAHRALDVAVDRCYRREAFTTERQRVEYLFALYEKLAAPLLAAESKKRGRGPSPFRGRPHRSAPRRIRPAPTLPPRFSAATKTSLTLRFTIAAADRCNPKG